MRGLKTLQQSPLKVYYKEELVGDYIADILVENEIIIEVKAVKEIDTIHFCLMLELSQDNRTKTLPFAKFQ